MGERASEMSHVTGIKDLTELLRRLNPVSDSERYVFCTVPEGFEGADSLDPLLQFHEDEGMTLLLKADRADSASLEYSGVWSRITLTIHSSLEAVGLLAAVTGVLADASIPCNAVSAYYHDHIFVPEHLADDALNALNELSR